MKQKYYLRGLGVGILITALVFVFAGPSELSEEEIIRYAESLGYVKEDTSSIHLKDLMSGTPEPTKPPTPEASKEPEPTKPPTPEASQEPEPTEPPIPEASQEPEPTEPPTPEASKAPVEVDVMLTETPTPVLTVTEAPKPTEVPEHRVITATIVVERGNTATMVCNKIEEAGILEDGAALRTYLMEHNLTDYINIGTYSLSNEMTVKEIAAILTGR